MRFGLLALVGSILASRASAAELRAKRQLDSVSETPLRTLSSAIRGTAAYPEVFGVALVTETNGGEVTIEASVEGLTDGCHGFHVHLYGDEVGDDDGNAAGGHWNPNGNPHAAPEQEVRHVGDLGNICSTNGKASYSKTFASDDPERPAIIGNFVNSIIGRSFVIHLNPDNFTTQSTGASGPRVAIGIIGIGNWRLATEETGIENIEVTEHITAPDFEVPTTLVCKIRGDGIIGFGAITVVDAGIEYRASVFGLEPGQRGAHIHWYGEEYKFTNDPDVGDRDLLRAGGHYDPTDVAHGLPDDPFREYGDAGNINVDETGYGFLQVILPAPIPDLRSLVGRTCLIHAGTDNGLEPAGNAGPRIAAGQLGYANPNTSIITPPQCFVKDCCEDDCCGKDTSWDDDLKTCVPDYGSPGYIGTGLAGCEFQSCCEEQCCGAGTYYDTSVTCCVPAPVDLKLKITNLSFLQPFSSFFVMVHNSKVDPLFVFGEPASGPLATLAEDGNPAELVDAYKDLPGVAYAGTAAGIPPGMMGEIDVTTSAAYPLVTIASMFVNTNDGFVSLNGRTLSPGDRITVAGYDAGSEENNEECISIPGPACTPESGNVRSKNGEGFVHVHRGFHGIGSNVGTRDGEPLDEDRYDWRNPMMVVEVE